MAAGWGPNRMFSLWGRISRCGAPSASMNLVAQPPSAAVTRAFLTLWLHLHPLETAPGSGEGLSFARDQRRQARLKVARYAARAERRDASASAG